MRRLVQLSLLMMLASCDAGRTTRPESPRLTVRVVDDRGIPVSRMPVRVMISSAEPLAASTNLDGRVDISVPVAGVYLVWVVPRIGYLGGTPGLSKSIAVTGAAVALVDFTVHREGVSTADPPTGIEQ